MSTPQELTLTRPDDWHLHLRDGAALPGRAAAHGPPVRPRHRHAQPAPAGDHRRAGRGLPRAHPRRPARRAWTSSPLMTLYLTDNTPADEIARAKDAGVVALKLYPAGATTNSDAGVTDMRKTYATLEAHAARRPAAAGARRGDRRRHRRVRPRGGVHRPGDDAAARATSPS